MLVSSTEPAPLRAIGRSSVLPESFGCDMLYPHKEGFAGIQRKEYSDLLASLHDGRLAKEMGQMRRLTIAVLIIEGKPQWTTGGVLIHRHITRPWTKQQHRSLMLSVQMKGVWVMQTDSLAETIEAAEGFGKWLEKDGHHALDRRPGPADQAVWGKAGNREFGSHLLQSCPGVGPELADRILEHFNGVPMQWTVGEKELCAVPGLGKKKAQRMLGVLAERDGEASVS